MKNKLLSLLTPTRLMRTFFLIMLLTGLMPVGTSVWAQTKYVTVNIQKEPLSKALTQIEKESGYRFLYSSDLVDVNKEVSINLTNKKIEEVLNTIFSDTNISYTIQDKQIVLRNTKMVNQITAKKVTGTVLDESGYPLIGVVVVVKGSAQGVITDENGQYSLQANPKDILVFKFLGHNTMEENVGNKTQINITLTENIQELEQVDVIGYGSVRKKDLTGSVSSIQGAAITDRKTSQLSAALQGSMPGVMVTRSNSAPGAQSTIRIRGITTIGNSDPLIIVDGVPADNINDINPNDVESITALKDAASASIYGSRAAAGVILITTKRAKSDRTAIEYSFEYGIDRPTRQPEYVDVVRFMEMTNELRWNDAGNGTDQYPAYAKNVIDNYMTLNQEDPDKYSNTNWKDLILDSWAPKQMHLLSISGGTNTIRSKATLGFDKVEGLHINRSYERLTVRMNNDIKVNKYISGGFDINVKRSKAIDPVSSPINGMRLAPPVFPALWADGRIASGKSGNNPYAALMYGGVNEQYYNQVNGKVALYITPLEDLKISAIVSPTYNDTKKKKFTQQVDYFSSTDPTVYEGAIEGHASTKLDEDRNDSYNITKQLFINYDKTFGDHGFNAMAGYEDFEYKYENMYAGSEKMEILIPYLQHANKKNLSVSGSADHTAYRSFFGRLMYNYQQKYLIQANLRHDSSSRFAKNHRSGTYPSVSGGWVVTEEKFIKDLDIKSLNFLKLRGSYGTLGNERIGNHPFLPLMNYTQAPFYNGNEKVMEMTAAQWQYAIRNVTWETTKTMDFGIDMVFLDNRFKASFDYYYKITKDMLLKLDIPDYVGFDDPEQNTGKMKTTGFDLEIGWNDRVGEFSYGISAHLSDFKSVMGYLGGTEFLGDQVKMQGSYINEWYGYKSDGLFQTQEEVDNYPTLNNNVKPGDIKYLDISGPNGVPDGLISPEYDRVLLGNSQPRYQYGATITAEYKGIDLNIVVQGVGSQKSRIEPAMVMPLRDNWGNTPKLIDGKYWSHYNTPEQNLNVEYPRLTYQQKDYNYARLSDYWLFNGGYFRLKNITLGYTLPRQITEKVAIKRARIYASANDILCMSKYPRGWDPEMGASSYPIVSSLLFGISVNF